jgi:hypothetical protein
LGKSEKSSDNIRARGRRLGPRKGGWSSFEGGRARYLLSLNVERISIDLLISLKVGKSYEANDGKSEEVAFNCELQW